LPEIKKCLLLSIPVEVVKLVTKNKQEIIMAKGNRSQKKEIKKPKKEKPKPAPASRKGS